MPKYIAFTSTGSRIPVTASSVDQAIEEGLKVNSLVVGAIPPTGTALDDLAIQQAIARVLR